MLQGGDLQLPGAASKAGDAGRRESVGKVPGGKLIHSFPLAASEHRAPLGSAQKLFHIRQIPCLRQLAC